METPSSHSILRLFTTAVRTTALECTGNSIQSIPGEARLAMACFQAKLCFVVSVFISALSLPPAWGAQSRTLTGLETPASWSDDFQDGFDESKWIASEWLGGWNGEFSFYTGPPSNRSQNLVVDDGVLYMQPDITANYRPDGKAALGWEGVLGCGRTDPSLQGTHVCVDRNKTVTLKARNCSVSFDPSKCAATSGECILEKTGLFSHKKICTYSTLPPVTSSLVRTRSSFLFGRLEIRARLPAGDWLWPAIWLLPEESVYGPWPTSGEIDIMESRGNEPNACGPLQGRGAFGSTLHFGPSPRHNAFLHAHTEASLAGNQDLSKEFHTYGLEWGPDGLYTYIDNRSATVLAINITGESFWSRGQKWEMKCLSKVVDTDGKSRCTLWLPSKPDWKGGDVITNPWQNATAAAPFDRAFFLQMNVAVGGTGKFFPDYFCRDKPWSNSEENPQASFASSFKDWWPTWGGDVDHPEHGAQRSSAMAIDWVRYWKP